MAEGRDLKIANFGRNLKLKRLENNIRGLFIKTRVKTKMKKLLHNNIFRYSLFVVTLRRHIKNFRKRKY